MKWNWKIFTVNWSYTILNEISFYICKKQILSSGLNDSIWNRPPHLNCFAWVCKDGVLSLKWYWRRIVIKSNIVVAKHSNIIHTGYIYTYRTYQIVAHKSNLTIFLFSQQQQPKKMRLNYTFYCAGNLTMSSWLLPLCE